MPERDFGFENIHNIHIRHTFNFELFKIFLFQPLCKENLIMEKSVDPLITLFTPIQDNRNSYYVFLRYCSIRPLWYGTYPRYILKSSKELVFAILHQ